MERGHLAIPALPRRSFAAVLSHFAHLFHVCVLTAGPFSLLFTFTGASGIWRMWVLLFLIAVESAFAATASHSKDAGAWVAQHVGTLGWGYLALNMTYVAVCSSALFSGHFSWIDIPVWFFCCGSCVYGLFFTRGQSSFDGGHQIVAQALAAILLFANLIYPHVKSEWGGGQPIDITIRFTKDSSVLASQKVGMQLIDEGDAGFYVLLPHQTRLLFIPRADIAAVSYSSDASSLP